MNIKEYIQTAHEHHLAGDLDLAENMYREIVKVEPDNAIIYNDLGNLLQEREQFDEAINCYQKAIELNPKFPGAYFNLGETFQNKGRLEDAMDCYKRVIELYPEFPGTYYNLGNIFEDKGLFDEAVTHYKKTIQLDSHHAMAHYTLGNVFQKMKHIDKAIEYYQNAIQIDPNFAEAYNDLGISCREKGQLDEAVSYYRTALQLNPNFAEAYNNLGIVLQEKGRLDEAVSCYEKTLKLSPNNYTACNNLGIVLQEKGRLDEAISYYRTALQLNPDYYKACNNLGIVLQEKGQLDEAVSYYQKALQLNPDYFIAYNNLGNVFFKQLKFEEAEKCFKNALNLNPDYSVAYSNFLFYMNFNYCYDSYAVFSKHLEFAKQFEKPLYAKISPHNNQRLTTRKLRIGYLSPDFKKHSVAYFIKPIILSHNKEEFEVFCYSNVSVADGVTTSLIEYSDQWRSIIGISDKEVTEIIRGDRIDILVDLAGHTAGNRILLFAQKPAPVQMSWIGYPATTGLTAINYKIVDDFTDPPGKTEQFYTETLIRLPDSFLCYLPEKDSPECSELPALQTGHVVFGSFNNLSKLSPEICMLWIKILRALPESRLIIKAQSLSDRTTRKYMMNRFIQGRIDEKRVELLPWTPSIGEHLGIYNRIDIALDTFPYHGTTTTCEAMWMGVPIITLAGNMHASRVGVSLLSNVGLKDLIAETSDEYIDIAVKLASDTARLRSLRERLRDMMKHSPLCDAKRFTANLEKCYREVWEKWCNSA